MLLRSRGTRRRRIAVLLASTLIASCVSYEPRPLVPADELAALRSRTLDGLEVERVLPGRGDARGHVFDLSDGLDESELVAVALTLNPGLRARREAIGESQALLISAGVWPNPELGASIRPSLDAHGSTSVGVDLLFELIRIGERDAKRQVAEAQVESVRADIAADEYRVAADVRKERIAVLAAEQVQRLFDQEAVLRDDAVALIHRRRDLGDATALDVVLVELERVEVQRGLREAQGELEQRRRSLLQLLGLPPTYALRLSDSGRAFTFSLFADLDDDQLDAGLLAGRFELSAGQAAYRKVEEELRLAIIRQYPSLKIGPSFEKDVEGSKSLGLVAAIELPIFDRNQGEIAEKAAARERIRAEYVTLLHALRAQAFDARATLRRARAEVDVQEREVVPLVERTESLFDGAFRSHDLTVFEWLTARSRALAAHREFLQALVHYTSAVAGLEAATGSPLTPASPPEEQK